MRAEILEEIGLTKSEIKVYMALLELGSTTTGKIVDKSGASSSKIYEILDKLMQKGLVSFIIKSGVKYFEAASPSRIMDYLQEKEKDLKKKEAELKELLPQLELKRSMAGIGSETQTFKGMKGAATAFDDILKTMKKGEEYYVLGISKFTPHFERFVVNVHKKRAKQGIKCKIIVNELARDIGKQLEPIKLTQTKYVQKELFSPFVFIIYKDKTLISIGLEEVFVQIKSDNLADGLRAYFDFIWKQDTTVSKGFDALNESLNAMLYSLNSGETYNVFGAAFGVKGSQEKYSSFFKKYHKKRIEKGVNVNLLFQQGTSKFVKEGEKVYTNKANVKYLPYETDSPVATFLAKEKTIMVIQEKEPTIITINNKKVTDSLKKNFDVLWNQETRVLKGLDAVQNIFEEMLEAGSCDFIGARGYFMDCRPKYVDEWEKRAIKKGFKMRNVVDPEVKGHRITTFPFVETKYTLQKEFSNLSVFWIYGDKVVISNWMEDEPTVIMIENKNLHKMYKEQFEVLWKMT
ncbi:TrmB family transcriptional regulator [candidate division KSB1 bacterium]